ncbi:unnamed protein product [Orchesella dallaii]|uniref:TIR domain-containing protein n=1 Tax=Orchesella dallaii TaxID=48710 RepID=A0ABP1QJX8_9HEXA
MACHGHLDRLLGIFQESISPSSSSSSPRKNAHPRRLLLSADRSLIYILFAPTTLIFSCLLLLLTSSTPVSGKYLEDCEKVSLLPGSSSDVSLSCKLRTINSEFDKTNFSSLSGDSIVSLMLECSNVLFYQSSLQAGSLAHLTRLQNLHIEHCKLSRLSPGVFSGLNLLKNLTIRTHNTAWPALSLDIASGVFSQLSQLEKIDISANNIWTFPDQLFCHTKSLEHLNVSLNRLQDISDLGFREREDKSSGNGSNINLSSSSLPHPNSRLPGFIISGGCRLGLQVLDISYNRLILLPARGLASLSQLKDLYLQGNEISMVADRALAGLKGLRVLNLTDNKVAGLPESLFQDSKEITEIYLQNNSLVSLPTRLFSGLEQLVVLDLSHNSLTSEWLVGKTSQDGGFFPKNNKNNEDNGNTNATTASVDSEMVTNAISGSTTTTSSSTDQLHPGVFEGLIRLVLLDLGHNELTHLSREPFQDLYSLQILNLEFNSIESILPDSFSAMNNLHTLILSHNKLTVIDSTALNGLFVLSLLSLDNNDIAQIHPTAFQNCSSLKDLNLNGNALERVPTALQNLTLLKTVDLGENMIEQLNPLIGLPNLYGLRLTGNRVVNVSNQVLQDLPSLRVLNLARNRIQTVERGSFDSNLHLQAVRLDANYLQDVSNLFADLPSLIWVNVSDNTLTGVLHFALFPRQLQWLDLHKNMITDLHFGTNDLQLQTLDASFNKLTRIGPQSIPDSIEMLFVNDNLINYIESDTFYNKANLSRVDLFANQLETLDIRALQLSPPHRQPHEPPQFYMGGNPFVCTCSMEWLTRINQLSALGQHPKIVDLDSIACRRTFSRSSISEVIPVLEGVVGEGTGVGGTPFLCTYTSVCLEPCHCCEYFACDCKNSCPDNCTCYHDATWSSNIVECSGHSTIPSRLPMDATTVYLDNNFIPLLTSHAFIGLKNLRSLFLNNSGIESIANSSFNGLQSVQTLHLERNNLKILNGFEFHHLTSVREIYLQNNQLTFIADTTFAGLRMLEVLRLDGNRLSTFSMWALSNNPYLSFIGIGGNTWSCNCEFLSQASIWVQSNLHKLMDASNVNCQMSTVNGRSLSLSLVYMNATKCSEITAISGAAEAAETKLPYLPLLAALMAICLLIGTVFLAVFRKFRNRMWAAAKCPLNRCFQTPLDDDREKLYDAYVAYSVQDEAYVTQVFAAELQKQNDYPYRLCLHYKDFPLNASVADTIFESVEASKRIILVLSKNFVSSEWCRFEFKSALHAALRGKRNRLIAITLGDIPTRDFDPDLRVCLRSATVLSANDKLFWAKLRCALPEPRASYTARTLKGMSRAGSGSGRSSAASVHNYTASSIGSTLPLNISDSSSNSNHLHHLNLNHQQHHPHHQASLPQCHTMTMNHHPHHAPPPTHQFFNSNTLGGGNTNGFLPNGNNTSHHHHQHHPHLNGNPITLSNGNCNGNNNPNNNSSSSNDNSANNSGTVQVPLYVPPFPPPNRPPPPFPAPRRPPPPAPLWA